MSQDEESVTIPLTERAAYALWSNDKIRFGDLDRQGHVNNAVFATFFETGRVQHLDGKEMALLAPNEMFVLARLAIDFRSELNYPGSVDIGLSLLSVGRSSYRMGQAIFDGERCAATAEAVVVLIDKTTRKSKPLTPRILAWLEATLAQQESVSAPE